MTDEEMAHWSWHLDCLAFRPPARWEKDQKPKIERLVNNELRKK